MREITVTGLGKFSFPSSMTNDEIKQAIDTKLLPKYGIYPARLQNQQSNQQQKPEETSYLQDAVQSGANFITGFGNAVNRPIAQLANLLAPQSMQVQVPGEVQGTPGALGGFTGDLATQLVGAGALNTARAGAEALPVVGQAAKYLGGQGVLPTAARLGTGYGAYGALMNPEDRLAGAEAGATIGAGSGAASNLISKLFPSNYLQGNLSPAQLQENLRLTQGTQTPLGDVVGSPALKRLFENTVSKNPFSGADQKMADIGTQISDRGKSILEGYLGDTHPADVNEKIGEGLINAKKQADVLKNSLYSNVNTLADQVGTKIDLSGLADKVKNYSDLINDQNFLKYEPDVKKLLTSLGNYGESLGSGVQPSLQEANMFAGRLNQLANSYGASPDVESRNLARVLGDLGRTTKQDIKNTLDQEGNESVKDAYLNAENNYKNNYSQFLDKDIYKFTNGGKDVDDILQTFIKTGSNSDKGNQLSKLMNVLDPETQNLVKYSYLSKAIKDGEFDPSAMKTALSSNKLGINQKRALFNQPGELSQLDDYSKLVGMNSEALNRMFNPKTGQRGLENAVYYAHGLGGLMGAGVGGSEGGGPGAMAGGLAGILAPALATRYLTNKITSEKFRNELINKMIQKQTSRRINKLAPILSSLYQNS